MLKRLKLIVLGLGALVLALGLALVLTRPAPAANWAIKIVGAGCLDADV